MKNVVDKLLADANDVATGANYTKDILHLSRQNDIGPLSPWLTGLLKTYSEPLYIMLKHPDEAVSALINQMVMYIEETKITNFVIGLSGGTDSSVCYALLHEIKKTKKDINIHAIALPIHQKQIETNLALELAHLYGEKLEVFDLTAAYDNIKPIIMENDETSKIRAGNVRARLRMMKLYDKAHSVGGVVISTDNFSEYTAGFWTINGDVGDIAPIRNLYKSVEVPMLGRYLGLPDKFWRVTPTDGLGISNGDEEQLGMSYLTWDIMATAFMTVTVVREKILAMKGNTDPLLLDYMEVGKAMTSFFPDIGVPSKEDVKLILKFLDRVYASWFKRLGVVNLASITDKISLFESAEKMAVIPFSAMKTDDLVKYNKLG